MNPIWRRAFNYIDARLYPQGQPGYVPPEMPNARPGLNMYDPIPDELLRNLPPWVGKLQKVAYWLMLPYAIALIVIYFSGAMGWW